MRIMVLGVEGAAGNDLALKLADMQGIAPISVGERLSENDREFALGFEQKLEQHLEQGFVLWNGPANQEQAAALDSLLDALDAPLELVIGIDTGQEDPTNRAAGLQPGADPLTDYYRERDLLRRIRNEGEAEDLLAVAGRIVDDQVRAQRPAGEDPFAAALRAIAQEAPSPATPGEEGDEVTEPARTAESNRPSSRWKRTAAQKGRLRRQPSGGRGGRKPRR